MPRSGFTMRSAPQPGNLLSRHGLELAVRIGIHSGEVLTVTIGGRYNRCYTADGFAVALASGWRPFAVPGSIYLSEDTAALAAGAAQLPDLGAFDVKGAALPVEVFELTGREPGAVSSGSAW